MSTRPLHKVPNSGFSCTTHGWMMNWECNSNIDGAFVVSQMKDKTMTGNFFICFPLSQRALIPGPPFLLGACTVVVAFLVALFIPEKPSCSSSSSQLSLSEKSHADGKESMSSLAGVHINTPLPGSDEENPPAASNEDFEPLLQDSIVWLAGGRTAEGGAYIVVLIDWRFIKEDKRTSNTFSLLQGGTNCAFIVRRLLFTALSSNCAVSLPEGGTRVITSLTRSSDQ